MTVRCGARLPYPNPRAQDLGRVEWQRKAFHSESNIWPVGYRSVRFYASRRRALPWACGRCQPGALQARAPPDLCGLLTFGR